VITRRQIGILGLAGLAVPATGTALAAPAKAPVRVQQTYLHAFEGKRAQLGKFLELNWLVWYGKAVKQGLLSHAVLYETTEPGIEESGYKIDYIFEIGYLTKGGYSDVIDKIQVIAAAHKLVLVDGEDLRGLGKVKDERQLVVRGMA
jgi:hypothetical protein